MYEEYYGFAQPPFSLTPFPNIRALDAWHACLARRYPGATFDTAEEAREFVAVLPRLSPA